MAPKSHGRSWEKAASGKCAMGAISSCEGARPRSHAHSTRRIGGSSSRTWPTHANVLIVLPASASERAVYHPLVRQSQRISLGAEPEPWGLHGVWVGARGLSWKEREKNDEGKLVVPTRASRMKASSSTPSGPDSCYLLFLLCNVSNERTNTREPRLSHDLVS